MHRYIYNSIFVTNLSSLCTNVSKEIRQRSVWCFSSTAAPKLRINSEN